MRGQTISAAIVLHGDGRVRVAEDDGATERRLERGDEGTVVAPRVEQRHGAHGVRAGAVRVEPLALTGGELAAGLHDGPRTAARRAPLALLARFHFSLAER